MRVGICIMIMSRPVMLGWRLEVPRIRPCRVKCTEACLKVRCKSARVLAPSSLELGVATGDRLPYALSAARMSGSISAGLTSNEYRFVGVPSTSATYEESLTVDASPCPLLGRRGRQSSPP